ncbi:CDP-alcohol phosphatidyltransferase family protein [Marinobacter sp. F4206]|uniref:CDP-alcohol phosphatidyltransferase family protein n=1 Tax=Marinobacter sp. F4206 TaxID=2861777 RepID=UPI001C5E529F|nr:CDP-alcohol phosphatidyltransferase family protein [Marinobacter sp. F4206]MBW4933441.1 CDP-alcohol phosphatidyltransferase family protein [Marinobacter sp. F4206]
MDSKGDSASSGTTVLQDLAWGAILTTGLVTVSVWLWSLPISFLLVAGGLYALVCWSVLRYWPINVDFGPANRATLLRASLVITLIASAPFADRFGQGDLWLYGFLALVSLILDGVDGAIARATKSQSQFGARFDMELDAAFLLGLCVALVAMDKTGLWVLTLGLMRYGFVAAGCQFSWLTRPLPDSFRRKTVCVWQIVTLMVAILPPVPPALGGLTLMTALALLAWSFWVDICWLYQRRNAHETA